MKKVLCGFAIAMVGLLIGGVLPTEAQAQDVSPATPAAPTSPDVVTLKNGSIIYGEVIEMVGGVLQIKTPASPDNLLLDTTLIRPENGSSGSKSMQYTLILVRRNYAERV